MIHDSYATLGVKLGRLRGLCLNFCAEHYSARSPDEWKVVQRHLCAEANCWLQHFAVVPDNCCMDKVDQLSSYKVGVCLILELKSQRRCQHKLQLRVKTDRRAESDWNHVVVCNVLYLMFRL